VDSWQLRQQIMQNMRQAGDNTLKHMNRQLKANAEQGQRILDASVRRNWKWSQEQMQAVARTLQMRRQAQQAAQGSQTRPPRQPQVVVWPRIVIVRVQRAEGQQRRWWG